MTRRPMARLLTDEERAELMAPPPGPVVLLEDQNGPLISMGLGRDYLAEHVYAPEDDSPNARCWDCNLRGDHPIHDGMGVDWQHVPDPDAEVLDDGTLRYR